MPNLLYGVCFRPDEQEGKLAGGQGRSEVLVPKFHLDNARAEALKLENRIDLIQDSHGSYCGEIQKEVIAEILGAIVVVPYVDNMTKTPLETYFKNGTPGLKLHAKEYSDLVNAAAYFGFNVPPREVLEADRSLVGKVRTTPFR